MPVITSTKRGGPRAGAGRKPKALQYGNVAAEMEARIAAALPEIVDVLIQQAKAGDLGAARYLCDRMLGKSAGANKAPVEDTRMPYSEEDAARDERERRYLQTLANLGA